MTATAERAAHLSSTKLTDDSLGQVMAFLKRLGDRGVQIGSLHAVRAEDVLADTLAKLMDRLTAEYFIIRAFRRMVMNSDYDAIRKKALLQHFGVGMVGDGRIDRIDVPGAVALSDLYTTLQDIDFGPKDIERTIWDFLDRYRHSSSWTRELRDLVKGYQKRFGTSAGVEFLCPIYVPKCLTGVAQINPQIRVTREEYYRSCRKTPRLTIED